MATIITVQAALDNNKEFKVPLNTLQLSTTLKRLVEDMNITEENADSFPIPVQITGENLDHIIEWCNHHKDGNATDLKGDICPRNVDEEVISDWVESNPIPQWDKEFLGKMRPDVLLQVLKDANYLHVKGLVELVSRTIAEMMSGKSAEELTREFGIIDDQTEEAKLAIDQEVAWLTNDNFNAQ